MSSAGDEPEKMQLSSFGFAKSKATKKIAVNISEEQERRTLLTGVEGSKLKAEAGEDTTISKQYVIARIENSYRTGVGSVEQQGNRKFAPSFKPPTDDIPSLKAGEDRFVLAERAAPLITEYGLTSNTRVKQEGGSGDSYAGGSITARLTGQQLEDQAYKEDMAALPDEANLEEYEAMPVEEFGKAMLRGMGWSEGMGVGRKKTVVDAIEYVRRPERLGLGAQPAPAAAVAKSHVVRMGDKPARADMVLAPEADGRQRNVRKLDEKLVLRKDVAPGAQVGKTMRLMAGRHEGLECSVLALLEREEGRSDRASVRLSLSNAVVEVRCKELGELWQRPAPPAAAAAAAAPEESRRGRESQGRSSDRTAQESDGGPKESNGASKRHRQSSAHASEAAAAGSSQEPEQASRGDRQLNNTQGQSSRDHNDDRIHSRNGASDRDRDREESSRGTKRASDRDSKHDVRRNDEDSQRGPGQQQQRQQQEYRDDPDDTRHRARKTNSHSEGRDVARAGSSRQDPESRQRKPDSERQSGRSREEDGQIGGKQQRGAEPATAASTSRSSGGADCWLARNIRVRVVDKSLAGGRLYLRKGTILEVHPGMIADVVCDGDGGLQHLPQASLETVVPKEPGTVLMVLRGEGKGEHAKLLQANASVAAVQLVGDLSILRVMLDDIAQFVGDLDE